MTMIFCPFGLRPGVMVKWSKIFDHDHGQNFKITMVKWSKFVNLTMAKLQVVMVMVNFFDH